MKPFRINRNSWHYKLNTHLFNSDRWCMERGWERSHSNFCSYWRATVLRILFATAMLAPVLLFVVLVVSSAISDPVGFSITLGFTVALVALAIGLGFFTYHLKSRKLKAVASEKPESLVAQRYRAYKSKICPYVEFKN